MQNLQNDDIAKALEASGIGIWQWNTESGVLSTDVLAQKLLGCGTHQNAFEAFAENAHKKDRLLVIDALNMALQTGVLNFKYKTSFSLLHVKGKRQSDAGNAIFHGTVQLLSVNDDAIFLRKQRVLQDIIDHSSVAISLYVGRDLTVGVANEMMLSFWGKDTSVIGMPLKDAVPELKGQPFLQILDDVFTSGKPYEITDGAADLALEGVFDTYYFDYIYKPLLDENGAVYAILNTAVNVTERVLSKRKMQLSETRFRAVTEQSPIAIGFLYGKNLVIEIANDRILEIWGKDKSIIGLPIHKALPEIEGQGFLELLNEVYSTGLPYHGNDTLAKLNKNGTIRDVYVDFTYAPIKDDGGKNIGVMVLATDVSEKMRTIREIEASEAKFRSLIYSAQTAVAVFTGPELVADVANDAFLQFVGRNNDQFVGKPLLESMPELTGQDSIKLMQDVFEKGLKTHHYGRQVNIVRDGVLTINYYNVSYTPLYNGEGTIYGVLDIAIDVTENIKTQQALAEAEASLRSAIELANLATWSLEPVTKELNYSERMLEWFGLTGDKDDVQYVLDCVHPDDRNRIQQSLFYAMQPESGGIYDEEYTVINRISGRERILHAQGRAYFDLNGLPTIFNGTVQDITVQKKLQLALENEVKERTIALQQANYELEEANMRLINSNEELAQYAYVASHDLQEPLRKISMFSNLLKEKGGDTSNRQIIEKIIGSSQRMSLLIKDLLEFSRLMNPDTRFKKTNLATIVHAVVNDFELLISEKNAEIIINDLPEIDAVPLQMNQLFYNLLGNALKFVADGTIPKITVSCRVLTSKEVIHYISNAAKGPFYKISIKDNGIGIEQQYQKQIFEVFKRLHTRTEYSGSGIGLAICRRIAVNHQGVIFAESEPGEGTTFNIILPQKQH